MAESNPEADVDSLLARLDADPNFVGVYAKDTVVSPGHAGVILQEVTKPQALTLGGLADMLSAQRVSRETVAQAYETAMEMSQGLVGSIRKKARELEELLKEFGSKVRHPSYSGKEQLEIPGTAEENRTKFRECKPDTVTYKISVDDERTVHIDAVWDHLEKWGSKSESTAETLYKVKISEPERRSWLGRALFNPDVKPAKVDFYTSGNWVNGADFMSWYVQRKEASASDSKSKASAYAIEQLGIACEAHIKRTSGEVAALKLGEKKGLIDIGNNERLNR